MLPEQLWDPKYPKMLMDHMGKGFSFQSFRGLVGVNMGVLNAWVELYPEFAEAVEIGEGKSQLWWERTGLAGVSGKLKAFKPQTYALHMASRFGMNQKVQKQEVSVQIMLPPNSRDDYESEAMETQTLALLPSNITLDIPVDDTIDEDYDDDESYEDDENE